MSAATVRDGLAAAAARLGGGADARFEAALLLAHLLGRGRTWLVAHADDPLAARHRHALARLAARRAAGEPVAYLLGRREFWSLDLAVTPAVLIPRPETELLVEHALALIPLHGRPRVCDAGTGSGAVAVAIARERPRARVIALDRSRTALVVAAANAARLAPAVSLLRGDWLAAIAPNSLDVLVSNPPYVCDADEHLGRGDLRFEPREALAAGIDGLAALTVLAEQSVRCLRRGGWLLAEHGADQGAAVRTLLATHGFEDVTTHTDLAGHDRVTRARRTAAAADGSRR